ncbi:MAG: pirin family protein [Burkholderiaceae bacterium]
MFEIRKSAERGMADHGWLKSAHSFSFASYFDQDNMGFGPLRVINEDQVIAGAGFGTHGHRNMEIISYVLQGELAHQDSMGNGSTISAGDIQRITAGTGIEHSEFNPQSDAGTHFLQIWIEPRSRDLTPGYEERRFDESSKRGCLKLVASGRGDRNVIEVNQDVRMYAGLFDADEQASWTLEAGRAAYLHLVRGTLQVNDQPLEAGDALKIKATGHALPIHLTQADDAEVLLFDLPGF